MAGWWWRTRVRWSAPAARSPRPGCRSRRPTDCRAISSSPAPNRCCPTRAASWSATPASAASWESRREIYRRHRAVHRRGRARGRQHCLGVRFVGGCVGLRSTLRGRRLAGLGSGGNRRAVHHRRRERSDRRAGRGVSAAATGRDHRVGHGDEPDRGRSGDRGRRRIRRPVGAQWRDVRGREPDHRLSGRQFRRGRGVGRGQCDPVVRRAERRHRSWAPAT